MAFIKTGAILIFIILLAACQSLPGVFKPGASKKAPSQPANDATASEAEFVLLPNPYLTSTPKLSSGAKADFARAKNAMVKGNWSLAEKLLLAMTERYPKLSGPYVNLALVYWQTQREEDARQALTYALELNNKNLDAYNQLAILEREQGRFNEAEKLYRQALKVWPHHAASNCNLGVLYDLYFGRFTEALSYYEMCAKVSSEPNRQLKAWIVDLKRRIAETSSAKGP